MKIKYLIIGIMLLALIGSVNAFSSNSLNSFNDNYISANDEEIMPIEYIYGQIFTASLDYQMNGIVLKIAPSDQEVTVSLKLVEEGDTYPTGNDLVNYTRNFDGSSDFSEVIFPMNYNLTNEGKYAIVISSNNNLLMIENTSGILEGGEKIYSMISPEIEWSAMDGDLYFKVLTNKSIENLTFIGNQNITTYLNIPQYTILTNGYLNLSSIDNSTSNFTIYIGDNKAINYTGNFTYQNNKTSNLAGIINTYLSSCSLIDSFCYVPFTFNSLTSGILKYFDLIFNNLGVLDNSVTYNPIAYEMSNQPFIYNFSIGFTNPISVSSILNYNGNGYISTTSCNLGNCLASNNLDIPIISTPVNKSFYWTVTYYNATSQFIANSSIYNQTINNLNLINCSSGNITLNFQAMDETSQNKITPFNFYGYFTYWLGSGLSYKNLTINLNSTDNVSICLTPNLNYTISGNIQYSASGYTQKDYYLYNMNITSQNNITLYLLESASSTSFIDEVLDTGRNPISDAYIYIQRCYPGSCQTVQVIKTDTNGRSIGFYKTETIDYQHIIMKNGVVIYQDSPHKIFATTAPYTNTFYVDYGTGLNFNYSLPSLYESLTYDNNTKLVTYTYIDSSSSFTQGRLLVELMNYSGSYGIVCNSTSVQSSATITCDMSTSPESNYLASGFITRGSTETLVDLIQFTLSTAKEIFGLFGLFMGFLIILTAGMAFLYHPIAGTWMVTIAMIFTNLIGFTSFTMVWIFGAVILSIIFTWFFRE